LGFKLGGDVIEGLRSFAAEGGLAEPAPSLPDVDLLRLLRKLLLVPGRLPVAVVGPNVEDGLTLVAPIGVDLISPPMLT
jgi:hypothetical protein